MLFFEGKLRPDLDFLIFALKREGTISSKKYELSFQVVLELLAFSNI